MNSPFRSLAVLLIALFALLVAAVALYQARTAKELALSDLTVEENNSLITPLYDQETGAWSYLAIYDIAVTNLSGPTLQWLYVQQNQKGGGFLVGVKNGELTAPSLAFTAFHCEPTLAEIQANPKLIRDLVKKEFTHPLMFNYALHAGESKSVRLGVMVQAFDQQQRPLVDTVLLSFGLTFDHDRQYTFRRAFPVTGLSPESSGR